MKPSIASVLTAGLLLAAAPAVAESPTVVEIFQSQGCSSCPPANANVMALSDRPDVLTLSFAVTYWDHLGWKDTFGDPAFTERQRDYARAFGRDSVFTPEVVVDGRLDLVGDDKRELERVVRRASGDAAPGPRIVLGDGEIAVGEGGPATARVWLVRYDPRIVDVPVARGENRGRTLPHRNVVREIVDLGDWTGEAASYALPPPADPALRAAVLVQDRRSGRILAAARD